MSLSEADRRCGRIAASQYGLINRTQARRAGLSDEAIKRRVQLGRWLTVMPTVFLLVGGRMDDRRWMMAAHLWGGDRSTISHASAAYLWGLDGFSGAEPYHLTVGYKGRAPIDKLLLHSSNNLADLEVVLADAIAVTSTRRTVFDLAAVGHRRLERALDQMLRQGLTSIDRLWLMIDRPSSFGRRGVRRLRNLLAVRSPDQAPTDSELEDLLFRVVRRAGDLPLPLAQYPVELGGETIRVDAAYVDSRLAIECDSYAWHMDREAFERDRWRDAELQGLGWRVLRVTWAQLRYDPDSVIALLRRHLDREVAPVYA